MIAASRRVKPKNDFRSNSAVGAEVHSYKIPDDQIKFCEKAAKISGLYYTAVDYLVHEDEIILLEVNGSPGSNAKYYSLERKQEISGDELVYDVLSYMGNKKKWSPTPTMTGLIEYMDVKGLGEYKAKLDTGNESCSSLHADKIEDLHTSVVFTIGDKKFKKEVVDRVKILVGSDTERRPVVHFDVKFGGREIKNVRFNLNDRSEYDYEILVGAEFLKKYHYCVDPGKNFLL